MAYQEKIGDSEFHMWRAVFAFAFVDSILSLEEQDILKSYINNVDFSPRQLEIIRADFKNPPDVTALHKKITRQQDRERFCILARTLAWCEGDMDRQEAEILKRVGCLAGDKNYEDAFKSSREYAGEFYQSYAKAGKAGLFRPLHNVEMRI